MALTADKVIVELQAKTDTYMKNVRNAQVDFDRRMDKIGKSALSAKSSLALASRGMAGVFGAFAGGFAAGGIAGLVSQLGSVAKSIAQIGDEAKRAGVATDVFQEWAAVAQQARIPVAALTDGLKELSIRGDEFAVTGKGPAAEAFARLGYGAADLKTKLEDPSALLLEIIGRLGKMDKAAQIRISDELFGGTAGERFVQLLDQGEEGIRRTITEAHRLGNVMDSEMIAKAAEVDRQFTIVSQTVGTALKSAIVNAAIALDDFIDKFNGFEARRDASLSEDVARLGKERLDVERKILELRDKQRSGGGVGDGIFGTSLGESTVGEALADHERRMEAIAAEEKMIVDILEARRKLRETPASSGGGFTPAPYVPPPATGGGGSASTKAAERAAKDAAEKIDRAVADQTAIAVDAATLLLGKHEKTNRGEINSFLKAGGVDLDAATTAWCAAFVNSALAQVGVKGSGSNVATDFLNWGKGVSAANIQKGDVLVDSNGRSAGQTGGHVGFATGNLRATADGISQIEMLSGNASDQVTTEWVNASEVVARRAADAFQIPADALSHLTQESTAAKLAADQLAASYKAWGQVAQTAVNGLATALADGKIEGRELLQILAQVVQQMLSMPSIGGGGGLGGFLSSLFGGIPGFAGGTNYAPGGLAVVGERGPELINLPRGSQIIPNNKIGGAAQQVRVTVGVSADNNGNLMPFVERVSQSTAGGVMKAGISEYDRGLPGRFGDIMERQG